MAADQDELDALLDHYSVEAEAAIASARAQEAAGARPTKRAKVAAAERAQEEALAQPLAPDSKCAGGGGGAAGAPPAHALEGLPACLPATHLSAGVRACWRRWATSRGRGWGGRGRGAPSRSRST